jgi:putative FmdB family regulatory protein
MPIYAYRCQECGHAKDVIQKFSDAPLTLCPACGADAFRKQLTAPAFQLKGSGWYVTDFRDSGKGKPADAGTADRHRRLQALKAAGRRASLPPKAAQGAVLRVMPKAVPKAAPRPRPLLPPKPLQPHPARRLPVQVAPEPRVRAPSPACLRPRPETDGCFVVTSSPAC